MTTQIVITGIGIISPYGIGPAVLWDHVQRGISALQPVTAYQIDHIQCRTGGYLTGFQPEQYFPSRVVRKLDRFAIFGLVATQLALQNAQLLDDARKPVWRQWEQEGQRVGIMVGNNLGGWEFAERELRNLWKLGPRDVSPYMATAWFPAAVQGNVSIQFGIKGIGRTFISDRASGAFALSHAADCLRRGRADIMIAGGVEAPFSPYAALCYETSGLMSKQAITGSAASYRPFDTAHDGLVPGEGAAFFVLERAEDARRRGVPIIAELAGWGTSNDGYDFVQPAPDGQRFAAAMKTAIQRADLTVNDIDCVFASGSAIPAEDISETRAIKLALGEKKALATPVSTPKAAFGNLFGAATPVDVAIAIQAMKQDVIPATLNLDQPADGCDLDYVAQTSRSVDHFSTSLVNSRGMGGTNVALVVRDWVA